MKNYELTKNVLVALLLVSTSAVAEDKYPASDFQPKVVYQDEAATKQSESSASSVSKSSSSSTSSSDSQYPAANFEPKVLYADENYKPNTSVSSGSGSSAGSSSSIAGVTGDVSASSVGVQKEESSVGYLLGLVIFAVAGFVLFKRGAGATSSGKSTVQPVARNTSGLTGVARYVMKASGTGVSRYLEKQAKNAPSSAATGVAKYLANQATSAKTTASQAVTGVEKYMRNKG